MPCSRRFSATREFSAFQLPSATRSLLQILAASKAQMIVGMAVFIHHAAPVPIRSAPPAPVLVGSVSVEDEPATFHLRIAQLAASAACHLAFIEGQIHVFSCIAV